MLRSASRSLVAGVLVIAGTWTGCVGEDPAITATGERGVGERLGPCFPDGKCKEGLVCRDGEICLTPDEPKPSGSDGGGQSPDDASNDGGSGDDAGGGDGGACGLVASGAGPMCTNEAPCTAGMACCKTDPGAPPVCTQRPACPQAVPSWHCETNAQCGSGICCFVGKFGAGSVCDFQLANATSTCASSVSECVTVLAGRPACTTTSDCPNAGLCSSVRAETSVGFTLNVKACPQ